MTPLLEVKNLSVAFSIQGKEFEAVRNLSFSLKKGETIGIVGESGSGKSAAVQAITGLTPGKTTGTVLFEGKNFTPQLLGRNIGMVFQDPMTSLNPTMKIGAQMTEGMIYHHIASKRLAKEKALELLKLIGIPDPTSRYQQYPHELSGGMRQRVAIGIALACNPQLLIADEPTTALDVTIQKQILDLIKELQKHFQMSLLLITHDLGVVAHSCEQIFVMYGGKIVERGTTEEILTAPRHPYTQMLLRCRPQLDTPKSEPLYTIAGAPPSLLKAIRGCPFKERCPKAQGICDEEPTGPVACWRPQ